MKNLNERTTKYIKIVGAFLAVCMVFGLFSSSIMKLASVNRIYLNRKNGAGNQAVATGNVSGSPITPVVPVPDTSVVAVLPSSGDTQPVTDATKAPDTQAPADTQAPGTTKKADDTKAPDTTKKPETTVTTTSAAKSVDKTKALNTYKKAVNAANKAKTGFTKVQYRTYENTNTSAKLFLSNVGKSFPDYFVSKDEAKSSPLVVAKGGNMSNLCIKSTSYACLLESKNAAAAIKSATSEKLSNGSVKLTIVFNNEKNPVATGADDKKAASFTGAVFDVLEASAAKEMISSQAIAASVSAVDLTYHDCKVELVYRPGTYKVISLVQTVNSTAGVSSKALSVFDSPCEAAITDIAEYSNFIY